MFIDELTPIFREMSGQPVAFLGGLFSGLFRLNLSDDPVKTWLDKQAGKPDSEASKASDQSNKNGGPQTISIE